MQHYWVEARSRPDPSLRGTRLNTALCLKNTLQMFPPSSKKTPTLPWVVDLCAALCTTHVVVACASKELVAVNLIWLQHAPLPPREPPRTGYRSPLSFLELPFYYLLGRWALRPKVNMTLMNVLTEVEAQRCMYFCQPFKLIFCYNYISWFSSALPLLVHIQLCPEGQFLKHHQWRSE